MFRKICGLYLFAVVVLVAVHTVAEPLYHASGPGQPYSPFWTIVNPLTALAIVLGAVFSYTRERRMWILVDAGVPLLAGAAGIHMLRSS